jgi:hypothetical protein
MVLYRPFRIGACADLHSAVFSFGSSAQSVAIVGGRVLGDIGCRTRIPMLRL